MPRYIIERHAQEAMSMLICDCLRDKRIPNYEDVKDALLTCPTADVVERKRGKWIEEAGMLMCSECGDAWGTQQFDEVMSFNYCPNCGAKMEGEDGNST